MSIKFCKDTRRACAPLETYNRVIKFSPLMGITRIANITGLDSVNMPVYVAYRPNSKSISVSQGKGLTHEAAKTSALMESVESWHAESIEAPLWMSSLTEVRNRNVVDVNKIPQRQSFTPHDRILWIEGVNLLSEQKTLLPYELVHLDCRLPFPTGQGYFIPSSTGLASGNNIVEAQIHALCEIIERDALATWQSQSPNAQDAGKIDMRTIDAQNCKSVLALFKAANIDVAVWDITTAIGIPVFLCRILDRQNHFVGAIRPSSGMGCHLSKDIALLRALTEAAQSRLGFISGSRDDLSRDGYERFLRDSEADRWLESMRMTQNLKDYRAVASAETDTLESDLTMLLETLQERNIEEIVCVDLTKDELGIPVVKIIVPGLKAPYIEYQSTLGQRAGYMGEGEAWQ